MSTPTSPPSAVGAPRLGKRTGDSHDPFEALATMANRAELDASVDGSPTFAPSLSRRPETGHPAMGDQSTQRYTLLQGTQLFGHQAERWAECEFNRMNDLSPELATVNRPSNIGDQTTGKPLAGQREGPAATRDGLKTIGPSSGAPSERIGDATGGQWWNRTRYQLYAPVYDWLAKPWEAGRRRAIERLELRPGERILVLGAGTGGDLEHLPSDSDVTTVDVSPAMVRRTAERAERLDLDVDARVGDAQSLPFEDDSFDAVLLHLVLSVVAQPGAVVAETARVLRPDGRASIYDKFVPEGEQPSLPRRVANPLARFLFADLNRSLEPMLAGTGLELEDREPFLGGLYTVTVARPSSIE